MSSRPSLRVEGSPSFFFYTSDLRTENKGKQNFVFLPARRWSGKRTFAVTEIFFPLFSCDPVFVIPHLLARLRRDAGSRVLVLSLFLKYIRTEKPSKTIFSSCHSEMNGQENRFARLFLSIFRGEAFPYDYETRFIEPFYPVEI